MSTSSVPRLGVAFVPTMPPERLHDLAAAVEAAGLDDLWVWEDCFKQSGLGSAAAALAWTSRVRVCIGLMPAPLRNVALLAMEVASLERMFPSRLVAGIGHGVQSWMGQAGVRADSPMTLLAEYAEALRRLLAGETVSVDGRYVQLDEVRLDWPPTTPPPLMLGGVGPKSLELAGRLGDGTLFGTAMTDEEIKTSCELTLAAARPGSAPHEVVGTQIAATGQGAQERLDREVRIWGKEPGQGVGVAGDAQTIADSVRRLAGLGLTTVVIQPTEDEPDLDSFIAFLGREVRPLVAA